MVRHHGLPLAWYSDRHGIFIKDPDRPATLTEQLTGKRSLTQVGRALDDLGVRWIGARSPQAKGRIERGWGTLQDRLVSELRRARTATLEDANAVLARYLPRHNVRTRSSRCSPSQNEPRPRNDHRRLPRRSGHGARAPTTPGDARLDSMSTTGVTKSLSG
jgi:hypothetical protein